MMRVLLVADSFDVRYWFEGALSRSGRAYSVHWVTAREADEQRTTLGNSDLIVVEVDRERGAGLEYLRDHARRGSATPLVAMLYAADADLELSAVRMGASAVIVRGDDSPGGIERIVRGAVERGKLARAIRVAPTSLCMVDEATVLDRIDLGRARAKRRRSSFAVAALELDSSDASRGLGTVADVAAAIDGLVDVAGTVDAVLRTGERSFVAVLEAGVDGRTFRQLGDRLLAGASRGHSEGAGALAPRIGLALFPDHAQRAEGLLELARGAVPRATGEASVGLHGTGAASKGTRAAELRRLLPKAVTTGELYLVYQPQVRITTGEVVGAEALLRWTSPELGHVSPVEFIPVAEEMGLIADLGARILVEACMQARKWKDEGVGIRVGVNVSARQFADGNLESVVRGALATSGIEAELLELEITEGVLLENTSDARRLLENLRELGVLIAVDDFGMGYSSFTYVKRLPMDVIKIDREFVHGLPLDAENAAISAAIVALARSLGLDVVAEGVENESEEEFLRSLGCDIVQGYLHGRPMRVPDFDSWRTGRRVSMVDARRSLFPTAKSRAGRT